MPSGQSVLRADIQGLRAVAVLPVLAFHVGFTIVPGGFVGVDIFFVISGFLITQLLQRDIEAGRFSLWGFYERRIRRIAPALVAMLLVTFAVAMYFDLPEELADLAKSLLAAAGSVSNFYFWTKSGYFDGGSASNPLLHTWSLAVEEQFYIGWPLYLYLVQRYLKSRFLLLTIALTVVSLAASAWGAFKHPTATFYLPFTRLWELSAGGLLALGAIPAVMSSRGVRELMGALGVALIVGSVFLIRSSMPFPGLLAVPPCLGAALVILAGRDGNTLVGKVLAFGPIAFVGAISYSLYLWHWPLTVFQRSDALLITGRSSGMIKLVIVAASFAAAIVSYAFIEQPFRNRRLGASRPTLMRWAAASLAVVACVASAALATDGLPGRFAPAELAMVAHLKTFEDDSWRPNRCFLYDEHGDQLAPECMQTDPVRKNYLLLGDSHAAQFWSGFSATFAGVNFLQASASNCFPTLTHAFNESPECADVMVRTLRDLEGNRRIDEVILLARWKESMLPALEETLEWLRLRAIRVTVLGPSAIYDAPVPRLVLFSMRKSDPKLLTRHMDASVFTLDGVMKPLVERHGAAYISLLEFECTQAPCMRDGETEWPEVFDQEHFNTAGALRMAARIRSRYPQFAQAQPVTQTDH
ncbi:MAG: acyltransferase [Proteobacteria bacterium]|nr:acyltransferase [Pseudomonadota bacterium]